MGLFSRKKWEELGTPISKADLQNKLEMFASKVMLRDKYYRAIPYKDFDYLLSMKREPSPKYRKDIMDCDDQVILALADIKRAWADLSYGNEALAFGYAEGVVEEGSHAWLWQIDDKFSVSFIDAESNKKMTGQPKDVDLIEG